MAEPRLDDAKKAEQPSRDDGSDIDPESNEFANRDQGGAVAVAATGAAAGALVGGATAAPVVVAGVQAVGFGAGGIVSGSTAAAIMSAEAIASGGAVAAGGTTATLQSIGATASLGALSAGSIAAIAVTGAVAGAAVLGGGAYLTYKYVWYKPDGQDPEQSQDGAKLGSWMVVTEESIRRFRFYRFENEETAWRYFNDAWHCCVILNDKERSRLREGIPTCTCSTSKIIVRGSSHTHAHRSRLFCGFCCDACCLTWQATESCADARSYRSVKEGATYRSLAAHGAYHLEQPSSLALAATLPRLAMRH